MELGTGKEKYIEAVYILSIKHERPVRNVDIANYLKVKRPSVSEAIQRIIDLGYMKKNEECELTLTDKGIDLGARIYERRQFWYHIFRHIGIEQKEAAKNAREMGYLLTEENFHKLKEYLEEHYEN